MLKGLAIFLLCFLLFLSLLIFGLVYTVNGTALNANFIVSQVDQLDVSVLMQEVLGKQEKQEPEEKFPEELMTALVDTVDKLEAPAKVQISAAIHRVYDYLLGRSQRPGLTDVLGETFINSAFVDSVMTELDLALLADQAISQQEDGLPEEVRTALVTTISDLEPMIKEKVSAASGPILDYLLGQTESIDLTDILRNTFLTQDFIDSLLEALPLADLAGGFLGDKVTGQIAADMEFLTEHLDDIIVEMEPAIKEEIGDATDSILDYLLGEGQNIRAELSLKPLVESLEDILKEIFLEQMPGEYAGLPQSELDQLFDEFFGELTEIMPSTYDIGDFLEDALPADTIDTITEGLAKAEEWLREARQEIAEAIADAEEQLEEAREYVGWYQMGYKALIGVIVLLILLIVLIERRVTATTRVVGIVFAVYGAIHFAGLVVGRNLVTPRIADLMAGEDIPQALQGLPQQLLSDLTAPLQVLSLGLLIGGVVLIAVSFVYPKLRQPSS